MLHISDWSIKLCCFISECQLQTSASIKNGHISFIVLKKLYKNALFIRIWKLKFSIWKQFQCMYTLYFACQIKHSTKLEMDTNSTYVDVLYYAARQHKCRPPICYSTSRARRASEGGKGRPFWGLRPHGRAFVPLLTTKPIQITCEPGKRTPLVHRYENNSVKAPLARNVNGPRKFSIDVRNYRCSRIWGFKKCEQITDGSITHRSIIQFDYSTLKKNRSNYERWRIASPQQNSSIEPYITFTNKRI